MTIHEPFVTPGLFWSDLFRVLSLLVGMVLMVAMTRLGLGLRNNRQWGCYCVAISSFGVVCMNYERFGHPLLFYTIVCSVALIPGYVYMVKVLGKELDWKNPGQH